MKKKKRRKIILFGCELIAQTLAYMQSSPRRLHKHFTIFVVFKCTVPQGVSVEMKTQNKTKLPTAIMCNKTGIIKTVPVLKPSHTLCA